MKKLFFLLFSFSFVFADDEFENILKQCFVIKKSEGVGFSSNLLIKKSKNSYTIDGQGNSLFVKMSFKIPDDTILILKDFSKLNGNKIKIIISKDALLKIECNVLTGEGISLEIFCVSKEECFEKQYLRLNNLDLKICYGACIKYVERFNTITFKLCEQFPLYEIRRNQFDLFSDLKLYSIDEKYYR
ncbi:MAG: hypothetical protein ABIA74_01190 [bacterium]